MTDQEIQIKNSLADTRNPLGSNPNSVYARLQQTPINASTIGTTQPMNLPALPVPTNQNSTIIGASASNVNPDYGVVHNGDGTFTVTPKQNEITKATDTAQSGMEKLQAMLGLLPKPEQGVESKIQSSQAQAQFDAAQKEVQNYTSQINNIVTQSQKQQLENEDTAGTRGITSDLLNRQNAQISRNAAIQALPLQALLANAQGNQQVAQQHLDQTYKLYAEDAKAQSDYQNKVFDVVSRFLDKSEERQYDELKTKNAQNYSLLTNTLNNTQALSKTALDNNDPQTAAKLAQLHPPTDPSSPDFASDLQAYNTSVANITQLMKPDALRAAQIASANRANRETTPTYSGQPLDPKRAQAINTILGSGKFTKDQSNSIRNAINSGEDPFTVIKNQAKALMTGANQTKVESYETAKSAMTDLNLLLKDFYTAGGQTGIFKGNFEKVANKLGEVNNPALVDLATQIQAQIQVYRNAISGTAYSEQEGKDIKSIFPGIDKGEILNTIIGNSRIKSFDSAIDGAYKSTLGSTYDQFKQAQNPVSTTVPLKVGAGGTLPGGVTWKIVK